MLAQALAKPQEAQGLRQQANQRFDEAAKQFVAAETAFSERVKPDPNAKEPDLAEWLEKLKMDDDDHDDAWFAAQAMAKWCGEHGHPEIVIENPPGRSGVLSYTLRAIGKSVPTFGQKLSPSFLLCVRVDASLPLVQSLLSCHYGKQTAAMASRNEGAAP